jgi:hypothetical protein
MGRSTAQEWSVNRVTHGLFVIAIDAISLKLTRFGNNLEILFVQARNMSVQGLTRSRNDVGLE